MAVEEFAESVLGALGAPMGKRTKTSVWLEPNFNLAKKDIKEIKDRPDALVVVDNGRRQWRALVEAKVKNAALQTEQVERYLDLAKSLEIDAVITISNQFVATPNQSPCEVNKLKLRKVNLFHWSWTYIETEAKIQLERSAISDPDQAYILSEFVRYLDDDAGVSGFDQMGKEWVEACKTLFAKSKVDRKSSICTAVVRDWDELMRSATLSMSRELQANVTTTMSAKDRKDPQGRLELMRSQFAESGLLCSRLEVPNAASPILVEADLTRRSLTLSMALDAPRDRKRPTATVTWLLRQLAKAEDNSLLLVAKWPGRTPDTCAELSRVREDPEVLLSDHKGQMPRTFELRSVTDLGGKFTQRRNFPWEVRDRIASFYKGVGQYVVPWRAPPPKPKQVATELPEQPAAIEE